MCNVRANARAMRHHSWEYSSETSKGDWIISIRRAPPLLVLLLRPVPSADMSLLVAHDDGVLGEVEPAERFFGDYFALSQHEKKGLLA